MTKWLNGIAYQPPTVCPYCKREFVEAEVKENGQHISVKCNHCGGWIHAKQAKGSNWAQMVKQRANYRCERCGKPVQGRGAHAHHKVPKWFMPKWEFDIENGMCLCTECHKQIHGGNGTITIEEEVNNEAYQ